MVGIVSTLESVRAAEPLPVPMRPEPYVARDRILGRCRAAWDVDSGGGRLRAEAGGPPSFCLAGPPGSGKSEIVHELVRERGAELYVIHGHADVAPEDLALTLVPDARRRPGRRVPLVLRASPLAMALLRGGLFYFDAIDRVRERTLAQLAPVLDERRALYSALTGGWIRAPDTGASHRFRFCCSIDSERGADLPAFLAQRAGPVIRVDPFSDRELAELLRTAPKARVEHER